MSEYTPADDARLSDALSLGCRLGRPSPRDEEIAVEDARASVYIPTLPEDDVE